MISILILILITSPLLPKCRCDPIQTSSSAPAIAYSSLISTSTPRELSALLPQNVNSSGPNDHRGSDALINEGSSSGQLDAKVTDFLKMGFSTGREAGRIFRNESAKTGGNADLEARAVWMAFGKVLKSIIDGLIVESVPRLLEATYSADISTECATSLLHVTRALGQQKTWVMRMLDSWGRPLSPGVLDGSVIDLGSFDECRMIREPLVGQYCLLKYRPPLPPRPRKLSVETRVFNFSATPLQGTFVEDFSGYTHALYDRFGRMGICTPSTCSRDDLQKLIDSLFAETHLKVTVSHCESGQSFPLKSVQLIMITVLMALALLAVVATSVELTMSYAPVELEERQLKVKQDNIIVRSLLCFSIYSNGQNLLSTASSPGSMLSLHGMKVLSMTWILWTHTYLVPIKEAFANSRIMMNATQGFIFQFILNGWIIVDSFFFVGALLATYCQLQLLNKTEGRINLGQIALARFLRLSPSVWLTVALIFVVPSLGSGPMWQEYFAPQVGKCEGYWWATVFYFNNWMSVDKMCLLHTWYLSADMQLFLFSLIFTIPLYKRPKLGIWMTSGTLLLSISGITISAYITESPPTVLYNTPSEGEVNAQAMSMYTPTYAHLGPYCVGILAGHLLYRHRIGAKYQLNHALVCLLWALALVGGTSIILLTYPLNRGLTWSPVASALYAGLHRTCWSLALAWITFACCTGYGGPMNTLLSWKLFLPLSRLSYMIYLMHFLVLWGRYAYSRAALPFGHYLMFCEFIVNTTLSVMAAVVAYLSVEAPATRLYKLYLTDGFKKAMTAPQKYNIITTSRL